MKRFLILAGSALLLVVVPTLASAFCGFYVNKAGGQLYADATRVVLMRDGKTTALTMQNNYAGPTEDFAMVVPVPQILQKENFKTLPHDVMDNIDKVTAPRLVEYWKPRRAKRGFGRIRGIGSTLGSPGPATSPKVAVEAEFTVGEYNIVVLSAKEATALDTWLRKANYNIPKGAAPYFEPYIQQGMYFFVARVDVSKVTFQDGKALLSPLRFHYESDDFSLPIRLGLINARGEQDLIVYTLGENQRYEVANRKNVFIPTNIEVDESVKDNFAGFYEEVFKTAIEQEPDAVVTEYAWQAGKCDPCPPGGALRQKDLMNFGGDVVSGTYQAYQTSKVVHRDEEIEKRASSHVGRLEDRVRQCSRTHSQEVGKNRLVVNLAFSPTGYVHQVTTSREDSKIGACIAQVLEEIRISRTDEDAVRNIYVEFIPVSFPMSTPAVSQFVVTRFHARYTKDQVGSDLVFRRATPVVGGREFNTGDGLERGANASSINNFQGRYIIRHDRHAPDGSTRTVTTPQAPVKRTGKIKPVDLKKVVKKKDRSRLGI